MEIHKPKWHSGNIKIWHILTFCIPPLLSLTASHSIPLSLLQGPEHICSRNSSEGHVNPPWHSWLSRQTDGRTDRSMDIFLRWSGRTQNLQLLPRRVKLVWTVQQIQGKADSTSFTSQPQASVKQMHYILPLLISNGDLNMLMTTSTVSFFF